MKYVESKFNAIMPETDEHVLCVQVDKLITKNGYENDFLRRIDQIIRAQGRARILVYYKDFHGWEEAAAKRDLKAVEEYRGKLDRIAFVNAPEKERSLSKYREVAVSGDIKFFSEEELLEAFAWVKS